MSDNRRCFDNRSEIEILEEKMNLLLVSLEQERMKRKEGCAELSGQIALLEEKHSRQIQVLSQTYEKRLTVLTNKLEAFTGQSIDDKSFRYIRFKILKNRSGGGYSQIGKIAFKNKGTFVDTKDAKATTPDPIANNGTEGPENAINYASSNKWCTPCSTPSMMIEFPRHVFVDEFTFTTANDCPERDPMKWILEGSNDKNNWTTLHYQKTDYPTTFNRNSPWQVWFPLNVR